MTPAEIVDALGLQPHPEGGWFAETYRSTDSISGDALHARYGGADRHHATAIYFLVTRESCSRMHRVASDEMFHFYGGDTCEQLQLAPGRAAEIVRIGADLAAGDRPQTLVPAGVWQGLRVAERGTHGWALFGCTVAPGFDFADFELATYDDLAPTWPTHLDLLRALT